VTGIALGSLGKVPEPGEAGETKAVCSRAGCPELATYTVNWRNPKIHSADRVKTWLACDDHVDYLREFVAARDFPVVVAPFGVAVSAV
jgi:hypothetical protein